MKTIRVVAAVVAKFATTAADGKTYQVESITIWI